MDGLVTIHGAIRIAAGNFSFAIQSSTDAFIAINASEIDALHYFNDVGALVAEKFELSIIHELIHIRSGFPKDLLDVNGDSVLNELDFNTPNYNHRGQVLPIQDQVAVELGYLQNKQISYHATVSNPDLRVSEFGTNSWFDGKTIDIARVGWIADDTIDHSTSSNNTRDLAFGHDGNDTISLGGGDDYAYGGRDNDSINGGDHNDKLLGESGDDTLQGGDGDNLLDGGEGEDLVTFGDVTDPVDVIFDGAADPGALLAATDSGAITDTIIAVERITLSDAADRVSRGSLS